MKLITSRENALFKELKQLATSAQARRKASCTLLDGVHLCQVYLEQIGQPQWCVVSESSQSHPEIAGLLAQPKHQVILADGLYQTLSQVENGVGIFFVVPIPNSELPTQITKSAVMLDNVQDPGNVGSILRSAAAAGIQQIFCSQKTVSAWSPKVLRAGMGAHFLLKIYENVDLLQMLENSPIVVLATSSHASKTVYEVDLMQPTIWLFGNEGQGLSEQLMQCATEQIAIPHLGKMESLNVAASAAVCFFEQVRQTTI
jgi:RNA methyltransferase, TrmH family